MPALNSPAPGFELDGVQGGRRRRFRLADFRGRWLILFFYPADFTFLCPTEAVGFEKGHAGFEAAGAAVVGVSADSPDSHEAWAKELGGLSFPLLSDPSRATCRAYGVLNEAEGRAFRGTFVISPEGTIAYMVVSPMNVGRSIEETYRVLAALQTGRLCPADWKPGGETFDPSVKS